MQCQLLATLLVVLPQLLLPGQAASIYNDDCDQWLGDDLPDISSYPWSDDYGANAAAASASASASAGDAGAAAAAATSSATSSDDYAAFDDAANTAESSASASASATAGQQLLRAPLGELVGNLRDSLSAYGDAGAVAGLVIDQVADQLLEKPTISRIGGFLRDGANAFAGIQPEIVQQVNQVANVLQSINAESSVSDLLRISGQTDQGNAELALGVVSNVLSSLQQYSSLLGIGGTPDGDCDGEPSGIEEAQLLLDGE